MKRMPVVYLHQHSVRDEEIDQLGHVNNVQYIRWMQVAAIAHSDAQGWTTADYQKLGAGWVVRSHFIEYLQPAFAGDQVTIRTWVAEMKRVTSLRKFEIYRINSEAEILLAKAETNWAFVEFTSGSLRRIPAEIAAAFELQSEDSPKFS